LEEGLEQAARTVATPAAAAEVGRGRAGAEELQRGDLAADKERRSGAVAKAAAAFFKRRGARQWPVRNREF